MSGKREFYLWLVSIIGTILIIIGLVEHGFEAVQAGKTVQRLRVEACKTVENEGLRVSCIEHASSKG